MDKTEYRAVIKFLILDDKSAEQVEERLTDVYAYPLLLQLSNTGGMNSSMTERVLMMIPS